jgi:hypothetical protein
VTAADKLPAAFSTLDAKQCTPTPPTSIQKIACLPQLPFSLSSSFFLLFFFPFLPPLLLPFLDRGLSHPQLVTLCLMPPQPTGIAPERSLRSIRPSTVHSSLDPVSHGCKARSGWFMQPNCPPTASYVRIQYRSVSRYGMIHWMALRRHVPMQHSKSYG